MSTPLEEQIEEMRERRAQLGVPSYGKPYRLEDDPHYRADRCYGPGHPFASFEHELEERRKIAQKVDEWIVRHAAEALKLRRHR